MTDRAVPSRAQAWTVVGLLALPIAVVVAVDRALVGWTLRDAGLLQAPTVAPVLGVAVVLLLRRRLPGLRTRFSPHVDVRVLRRSVLALLLVVGLLVSWNQLCLLFGWLPAPRIDLDAGLPFAARVAAYAPLAVVQEMAWRGIVRPTLRAVHGWLAAAVGTGVVWGLLGALTWRFSLGFGLLMVVTTTGWSVLLATVLEEMRRGQLVAAVVFQWALMVALFLLLPEETGVGHAAEVLALSAVLWAAAAAAVYGRSRRHRGRTRFA